MSQHFNFWFRFWQFSLHIIYYSFEIFLALFLIALSIYIYELWNFRTKKQIIYKFSIIECNIGKIQNCAIFWHLPRRNIVSYKRQKPKWLDLHKIFTLPKTINSLDYYYKWPLLLRSILTISLGFENWAAHSRLLYY